MVPVLAGGGLLLPGDGGPAVTGVTAASPVGGHHCRAGPGTTPRRWRGGLNGPRRSPVCGGSTTMCHADPAGRLGPCLSPLAPRSRTCGSSLGPRRESVPAAQNGTRDASSRGRRGGKQRGESCSREAARSNRVFPGVSWVLPSLLFIGFPMAGLHCRSGRSVFLSFDFPVLSGIRFPRLPVRFLRRRKSVGGTASPVLRTPRETAGNAHRGSAAEDDPATFHHTGFQH